APFPALPPEEEGVSWRLILTSSREAGGDARFLDGRHYLIRLPLALYRLKNNHLDPPVLPSPFGRIIRRRWMELPIAAGRQTLGRKIAALGQKSRDVQRPSGRQFPVGGKFFGVDRDIIGMTLDAYLMGKILQDRRYPNEGFPRFRQDKSLAGLEEHRFRNTDRDSPLSMSNF